MIELMPLFFLILLPFIMFDNCRGYARQTIFGKSFDDMYAYQEGWRRAENY